MHSPGPEVWLQSNPKTVPKPCNEGATHCNRRRSPGGIVAVVDRWNGRIACLLQMASGMTVERFAGKLGVAPRTVSYWRSRPHAYLSTQNQAILDTAYEQFSASDLAAMQGFRAADQKVGGGHLYATVVSYLHTEVAPRLFDAGHDHHDGRGIYTAAAGLTEMAGWMAHDAGRDNVAQQHFTRALDLAKLGGDTQLAAHVFASMSHLAHHVGNPKLAIEHAGAGRTLLEGRPREEAGPANGHAGARVRGAWRGRQQHAPTKRGGIDSRAGG